LNCGAVNPSLPLVVEWVRLLMSYKIFNRQEQNDSRFQLLLGKKM